MEEGQKILLKIDMQFMTAFKIGLGIALASLVVFIIPWIIIVVVIGALPMMFNY